MISYVLCTKDPRNDYIDAVIKVYDTRKQAEKDLEQLELQTFSEFTRWSLPQNTEMVYLFSYTSKENFHRAIGSITKDPRVSNYLIPYFFRNGKCKNKRSFKEIVETAHHKFPGKWSVQRVLANLHTNFLYETAVIYEVDRKEASAHEIIQDQLERQ